MRRRMTPPEVRLWVRLRSRRDHGVAIRRQHPEGDYILDFYCDEARLAIEVDGANHGFARQIAHDEARDAWLTGQKIETLRIPAGDIMTDADTAAEHVMAHIRRRLGV